MARTKKKKDSESPPLDKKERQDEKKPKRDRKGKKDATPMDNEETKEEKSPAMKKERRNKSQVEKTLLEDKKEGESSTLRYYIIMCELRHATADFHQRRKVLHMLNVNAETQGVYRKLTGCLANFVMLFYIENGWDCPTLDKTFYDQCWSALDNKRKRLAKIKKEEGKTQVNKKKKQKEDTGGGDDNNGGSDHRPKMSIADILDVMISTTGLDLMLIPEPVKFETRSPTTRDMAVSALNHIEMNLEKRIVSYVRSRLANIPSARSIKNKSIRFLSSQIVRMAMKGKTSLDPDFDLKESAFSREEVDGVLKEVGQEILPYIPDSPKKSLSKSLRVNAHRLLPFLYKISRHHETTQNKRHTIRDGHPELMKERRDVRRKTLEPLYRYSGLRQPGKPFSLLPDWQLQPVFVDFAHTQLESLFGNKMGTLEFFQNHVFNLQRVKHLLKPDWYFMGFRTNGVELHVRLGCLQCRHPPSPNSPNLIDAGYNLPKPKTPVDITTTERGVYRVLQDRYDLAKVEPEQSTNVTVVLVDPGLTKPVAVREVLLSDCVSAKSVFKNSTTWHMDEDTYKEETLWGYCREQETKRRSGRRLYPFIIKDLQQTAKRTCSLERYNEYLWCYLGNIRPLFRELTSRTRRVTRYIVTKSIQKCLDKLADRLMKKPVDAPKDKVRVVFYGDGHFKPSKGHVSVPTKKLVKRCCHRGIIVMLSERGTSKYCPNCVGGIMMDIKGKRRIRCCTSNPKAAHPCVFTYTHVDRDDCATISMALCAAEALLNHSRPAQFCV